MPKARLDLDRLMAQAEGYAESVGVLFDRTFPAWMRTGFQRLVGALNAPQAGLLEERRPHVVYELTRQLRNNAALALEWQQHPEIEGEEITRPVFIVGINRTGTTFLHRLMARDRRFWTLRRYELAEPVLSSGEYNTVARTAGDPRRLHVKEVLESIRVVDQFVEMHRIDIDQPEEDFPILRQSFASWVNAVAFYVPDYRCWLAATGSDNAYAYHHRVMRHFTWQRRQRERDARKGWLLKMPFHLMELEALLANYPDAIFYPDPSRAGAVHGIVEQPGGPDTLHLHRAAPATRHRCRATGPDERHAQRGDAVPGVAPRARIALGRCELPRPGREPRWEW